MTSNLVLDELHVANVLPASQQASKLKLNMLDSRLRVYNSCKASSCSSNLLRKHLQTNFGNCLLHAVLVNCS